MHISIVVPAISLAEMEKCMSKTSYSCANYGDSVLVLVPRSECQLKWAYLIKRGSAIVGRQVSDNEYSIYYEGNIYKASNINSFGDKAYLAYSRLTLRASTSACCEASMAEFEVVGTMTNKKLDVDFGSDALVFWVGYDPLFDCRDH